MIAANIHIPSKRAKYSFNVKDEDAIADFIQREFGDTVGDNGVPLYMEASSWCSLACIGEVFSNDLFTIDLEDLSISESL